MKVIEYQNPFKEIPRMAFHFVGIGSFDEGVVKTNHGFFQMGPWEEVSTLNDCMTDSQCGVWH